MSITYTPAEPENFHSAFPEIEPYQTGYYAVDNEHEIYWEQVGNPNGLPVIWLHGGPGSGNSDSKRQIFDPQKWNMVLHDQRGCGRSKPAAETKHNTLQDLINDMESLRQHLGFEKWWVMGSSWGATLALAYAAQFPERVLGVVSAGTFFGTQTEIQNLYSEHGFPAQLYPREYQRMVQFLPRTLRSDPMAGYCQMVRHSDEGVAQKATLELSRWELTVLDIVPDWDFINTLEYSAELAQSMLVYTHYHQHNYFIDPQNPLLEKAAKMLKNIPVFIIHGQYDILCPVKNAYALHDAVPQSKLTVVSNAGHRSGNPMYKSALIQLINEQAYDADIQHKAA